MATVLAKPTYTDPVPSQSTSENLPPCDLDWMASLSPTRRSCIKLSSVEPCVNKAIAHLDNLKTQIDDCNRQLIELRAKHDTRVQISETASPAPKSILIDDSGSGSSASGHTSRLIIEGVTTGIPIEKKKDKMVKLHRMDGEEVISGAIKLVVRLEQDRQETLDSLQNEKIRVETLSKNLDKECERRLKLLPVVVQAEHDECLRDLIELKWHVNFDRRQLGRVKDDLRLTTLTHNKLKQSVDYYKENCPLLEEKLVIENDHMSEITRDQQETSDKLSQAKHSLSQTEDKSSKAHKHASRERDDMDNTLDECRMALVMSQSELKEAVTETAAITHQMNDCRAKISENKKQMNNLDDKTAKTKSYLSQVEGRVSLLRKNHSAMEQEQLNLKKKLERLKEKKQLEHGTLESEHVLLMAEMQKEDHKLREVRDANEELQHAIDTLKENIALFNKQTHDDEKSVERARRELIKLDEQMGVSVAQFTKVREEHVHLSEQLKTDEAKAGDIEHSLRTKSDALKQQIKDEGRTIVMYDGKVQAGSAELDKLKAECQKQAEVAEKLALESDTQSTGQTDLVNTLQKKLDDEESLLESLKSQLACVQSEHATVEKELTERISLLTPQVKQLTEEMQTKISRVDTVSERIKVLKRKIEDVVKSSAMLDKMEVSTNATIESLESQVSTLKEKLAAEKEEEQRCRQEYKEITEFSSDADEKHQEYLEKRLELLKQCKVDLFKAHGFNTKLAEEYQKLQYEFIAAKARALQVLERKLDMETSLRDHKQLLAFQSRIYSAMKAYYEHRGSKGWQDVTHFYKESKHSAECLKLLQAQFRTVIELMNEFLQHGLT